MHTSIIAGPPYFFSVPEVQPQFQPPVAVGREVSAVRQPVGD